MSSLKGNIEKIRPKRRKNGLPGGWGTPNVWETAINSPQSQYDTVGAIVSKYTMKVKRKIPKAISLFM